MRRHLVFADDRKAEPALLFRGIALRCCGGAGISGLIRIAGIDLDILNNQ
jgi:hypothetical protein